MRTPGGIGLPHVLDECADLLGNGGAARRALLTQVPPVVPNALLLPGEDRAGLDEYQGMAPAWPKPGQSPLEHPIGPTAARPVDGLLIDRQLMPKGQMFLAQ